MVAEEARKATEERRRLRSENKDMFFGRKRSHSQGSPTPTPQKKGSFPEGEGIAARLYQQEQKRRERLEKAQAEKVAAEEQERHTYKKVVRSESEVLNRLTNRSWGSHHREVQEEAAPALKSAAEVIKEEAAQQRQKVKEASSRSLWKRETELERERKSKRDAKPVNPKAALPAGEGFVGRMYQQEKVKQGWPHWESLIVSGSPLLSVGVPDCCGCAQVKQERLEKLRVEELEREEAKLNESRKKVVMSDEQRLAFIDRLKNQQEAREAKLEADRQAQDATPGKNAKKMTDAEREEFYQR